jgi:hypothetical protein
MDVVLIRAGDWGISERGREGELGFLILILYQGLQISSGIIERQLGISVWGCCVTQYCVAQCFLADGISRGVENLGVGVLCGSMLLADGCAMTASDACLIECT